MRKRGEKPQPQKEGVKYEISGLLTASLGLFGADHIQLGPSQPEQWGYLFILY